MKHKIIVAGCGSMSNTWFDYVEKRDDAVIVGVVDLFRETAKAMVDKRKLDVPIFSTIEEALEQVDANLVFDVTIPASHKDVTTAALRAGCHVFGEKPMAESLSDAQIVLDLAEQSDTSYAVMQNRRFLKQVRSLRNFIANDEIGQIGTIHADFFIGAHFGGFRDAMDHPLILDMAIHTFDVARFISGADAVSVYCQEFNPTGSWYAGNASAICIFEMSNGAIFTYRGSWCSEGFPTSWEGDWRIIGEKGTVKWDGHKMPVAERVVEPQEQTFTRKYEQVGVEASWFGQEGHWGCLDEMFAALNENRLAETDCSDNIKSMEMVFGAIESAKTGKKISLK